MSNRQDVSNTSSKAPADEHGALASLPGRLRRTHPVRFHSLGREQMVLEVKDLPYPGSGCSLAC